MKKCPNCGEIIKDESDVCGNCGALSSDLQNLLDELSGKNEKSIKENKKDEDKVKLEKIDISNYMDSKEEEQVDGIEGLNPHHETTENEQVETAVADCDASEGTSAGDERTRHAARRRRGARRTFVRRACGPRPLGQCC